MEWLEDDPESLGAALSMLAGWDHGAPDDEAHDSSSNGSSRAASPDSRDAVTRRRSVNVSRERQQQEIRMLRRHVKELEKQLASKKKSWDQWVERHCVSETTTDSAKGTQLWASLASRQWRARQKAEQLNLQLRAMVKQQMSIADELKRVIWQANLVREQTPSMATLLPLLSSHPRTIQDVVFEQQLLQGLNAISAQWAVAFSKCKKFREVQPFVPRFLDMHLSRDGVNEKTLDVYSSSVYPFDAGSVAETLWAFFATEFRSEDDYSWSTATQSWRENDVHVSSFQATTKRGESIGMLRGQCARKRFVNNEGHTVIATAICAIPVGSSNGHNDAYFIIREESWVRFVDVDEVLASREGGNKQRDTSPLSVIQHVRRTRVEAMTSQTPPKHDFEELTEMLKRLIVGELAVGEVGIEEMLMHRSAKRSKRELAPHATNK